jgi:hypothetical protein
MRPRLGDRQTVARRLLDTKPRGPEANEGLRGGKNSMSFYQIVRAALRIKRERGAFATVRFLKRVGVNLEDRRKILGAAH